MKKTWASALICSAIALTAADNLLKNGRTVFKIRLAPSEMTLLKLTK